MFTGIIEEIGTLSQIERGSSFCHLTIRADTVLDDCKQGDSIAVNGTCLTVTRILRDGFVADVMAEAFFTRCRSRSPHLRHVAEKIRILQTQMSDDGPWTDGRVELMVTSMLTDVERGVEA